MKKVKILTDKYIVHLGIQGPILTPISISDTMYDSLKQTGIKMEMVEPKVYTPSEGDKVLFTGEVKEEEKEIGEAIKQESEVKISGEYSNTYGKNKKKR